MDTESDTRRELHAVEQYLERLLEHVRRVEGHRDTLLLKLTDLEGAHDRRFAGVR